ncbi:hypothetical protein ABWL39_19635 [Chitinivorax sp. PXF-14]|uniref:hypothetical protein n=1 Tax=Chitinivorax sp. PXF-14 TaxID=3230488 RepID=UPI00346736CF
MVAKMRIVAAILLCLLCPPALADGKAALQAVQLITYYDFPPWIVPDEDGAGLNAELAAKLTQYASGRFRFESYYLPRPRLDRLLESPSAPVLVAWVSPRFFDDEANAWWSPPLLSDVSYVVSPRNRPLAYHGTASLIGKHFSGARGHRYPDIDDLISTGSITREDARGIPEAVRKLLAPRGLDFAFADRSTLDYLKQQADFNFGTLYIAPEPRVPSFTRHLMLHGQAPELSRFLQQALPALQHDASWRASMAAYGLHMAEPN